MAFTRRLRHCVADLSRCTQNGRYFRSQAMRFGDSPTLVATCIAGHSLCNSFRYRPHMRTISLIAGIGTLLLLSGCDLLTGPGKRVVGIVDRVSTVSGAAATAGPDMYVLSVASDLAAPPLVVPDTVDVGREFSITVDTYGPDGCWQAAGTDVNQKDLVISIVAYDRKEQGPDVMCPMEPVRLPRMLNAAFNASGTGVVKLTGRRIYESGEAPDTITIEKVVVVR